MKISIITSLYRGGEYLESFLDTFIKHHISDDVELVIIHNDPTDEELKIVNKYTERIKNLVHIKVERESVYKSWNRGIKNSSGKYIAIWNIDDIRTSAGLRAQANFLDEHSDCEIVTGDYIKTFSYNSREGVFKKDNLKKSLFYGVPRFRNGCFLMWRKELHDKHGYFDEQLRVIGDREFWYRVVNKNNVGRVDELLGYYLRDAEFGISKTNHKLRDIESGLVYRRYSNIYVVNVFNLKETNKLDVNTIYNFDEAQELLAGFKENNYIEIFSYVLFFYPYLKKHIIELKFYLLKHVMRK